MIRETDANFFYCTGRDTHEPYFFKERRRQVTYVRDLLLGDKGEGYLTQLNTYGFWCRSWDCNSSFEFKHRTLVEIVELMAAVRGEMQGPRRPMYLPTDSYDFLPRTLRGFGSDIDLSWAELVLGWTRSQKATST